MWIVLTLLVLIDGLVGRNPQPWAAPIRAGTIAALVGVGIVLLWRARVRLSPGTVALVGVLAALAVADLYQRSTIGISTWLVYAGAYILQGAIKRDWSSDLAITGVSLSALALVVVTGNLVGIDKPMQLWHRNTTAGIMAVTLPAAMTFPGRKRWIVSLMIAVGILLTTSRGAIIGAAAGSAIMIQPLALIAAPLLAIGMGVLTRRVEAVFRLYYWMQGLEVWRQSLAFGVGPNLQLAEGGIHVHNTFLGIATQTGIAGLSIISAMATLVKRVHFARWQLATLAVVAVHGLVDDPLAWLPVGVITSLALVGSTPSERR